MTQLEAPAPSPQAAESRSTLCQQPSASGPGASQMAVSGASQWPFPWKGLGKRREALLWGAEGRGWTQELRREPLKEVRAPQSPKATLPAPALTPPTQCLAEDHGHPLVLTHGPTALPESGSAASHSPD